MRYKSIHGAYLRRLFSYTFRNKRLLAMVLLTGLLGFLVTYLFPWMVGALIDHVIAPQPGPDGTLPSQYERQSYLILLTCVAAGAAIVVGLAGFGRGHYTMKLGNRIVTELRQDLFDHLQQLSLHFYAKQRAGGIVNRLIHDVHGVNGVIHGGIILVFLDLINVSIVITILSRISGRLTLAALLILPLYVAVFKFFAPRVRDASERVSQHFGRFCSNIHEQITAMALIKCYAAEEREAKRFFDDTEEHYQHVVRQSRVGHAVGACSETCIHLGTTVIIGLGGYLALNPANHLTAGDVTKFIGYVGILYGPIRRFADLNIVYQNSLAAIRRVFRIFDITPRIQDKPNAVPQIPNGGEVVYEGVRFHYDDDCDESRVRLDEDESAAAKEAKDQVALTFHPAPRWVLDGIDLRIEPGERIALVGPSGAGKTTIASLLPRLYDPVAGRILIDGIDVRDYSLHALRAAIAVVQQDSFVFSGTVRDNLCYGRPQATDREIIEAAEAANAHEFVSKLPNGYNTLLGERGVNLSGGQRQRLSIARALLKNPRILVLDEATSSLDVESEALVQKALDRLMLGRTCLVIAHRLSTIRNADRILVLGRGRIVESGSHDTLMELNGGTGLYARMVRQQYGLEPREELKIA